MTQKIYPLNPIFETTTRDGRRAWVAFYAPEERRTWLGRSETTEALSWHFNGRISRIERRDGDLTTPPKIPADAREPKPGEVWEVTNGMGFYLTKRPGAPGGVWEGWTAAFGAGTVDRSTLTRPWPSDRPHGFEGLIEAILRAHGGKP